MVYHEFYGSPARQPHGGPARQPHGGPESQLHGSLARQPHYSSRPRTEQEILEEAKNVIVAKGWCIHKANYLSQVFDLITFLDLSQLGGNPRGTTFHDQCLEKDSCQAYNVDTRNYKTQHVRDDCVC